MRVESSGLAPGWQMPGSRAANNLQMPRGNLGGAGGGWAQLELTDAQGNQMVLAKT